MGRNGDLADTLGELADGTGEQESVPLQRKTNTGPDSSAG